MCIKFLSCRSVDGTDVLIAAPDVRCYTPGHTMAMLTSLFILVTMSIVVPLVISFFNILSVYDGGGGHNAGGSEAEDGSKPHLPRLCELLFGRAIQRLVASAWVDPDKQALALQASTNNLTLLAMPAAVNARRRSSIASVHALEDVSKVGVPPRRVSQFVAPDSTDVHVGNTRPARCSTLSTYSLSQYTGLRII
jgi:hypothetical protein